MGRIKERLPVQISKIAHIKLEDLAESSNLTMGDILEKQIKKIAERCSALATDKNFAGTELPPYFVYELLHLRDLGIIAPAEFIRLLTKDRYFPVIAEVVKSDDLREKREIIDKFQDKLVERAKEQMEAAKKKFKKQPKGSADGQAIDK